MTGYTVDETNAGKRLDVYLAEQVPELSRSQIQKLCKTGNVVVNSGSTRTSSKLKFNDHVELRVDLTELNTSQPLDLPIIFEDDNVIVVNKPVGILTHSKGSFNTEGTVASFLEPYWQDEITTERNGIVHRLDRATSGVMICAKNQATQQYLQKQFNQRKTKKTYYAIVPSGMEPEHAVIDMPIARNPKQPKTFHVSSYGKPSQTEYQVEETHGNYSLLQLTPVTGRTHQLRVHLAQLKHPIVGDEFYDGQKADRLYLHAQSLEITIPKSDRRVFTAPLPDSFKKWLNDHAE